MRFFPVVTYCCAGKWTVPRGRTALVYSLVLYGTFVLCVRILCRSGCSLSSLNKRGNVCCLVASGIFQPAIGSPSVLQRYQTWHGTMLLWIKCGNRFKSGPGSSVGIATDDGLDGPGPNPGGGEIFRPSRPALGPHTASCNMGTGSFARVKCGRGVLLTSHPLLVPRS